MKLFRPIIDFLGYNIQYGSYTVIQRSLSFVDHFPDEIKDKTQLQRFLGSLNYISKFLKHCAQERKLLNKRLQKDPIPWNNDCTQAVRAIKEKVRNIQPLSPIREEWEKIIMTDASYEGWGAVLRQKNPNSKNEIEICQYASGLWAKSQLNWSSLKKELRAVCLGIEKFREFVIYTKFTIKTDCQDLKFAIHKCDFEDVAMVRWIMQLSQYIFDIEFVKGNKNSFADMLSREFFTEHSIMCLHCKFIRRYEDTVEIETYSSWISYDFDKSLVDHNDDVWRPVKEVRYRIGIDFLSTDPHQDEANNEALEALDYLR